ncbi:MAG: Gfo/Idh/MocA family oxidoreductase [Armatimonadota bacterium]|nr:Gfo/Idh/MocA family oxidoreductase [Armatimonadota bacterium]
MERVNLGLMGLGHWGREAYTPILKDHPAARVVAVSARSEGTFAFAREQFGTNIAEHRDLGDLADDSSVEAVMIALPNRLHAEAVEAAVSAGKHVFVEPPLGFDAEEISRVVDVASAADTIVQTDLELRYTPVMGFVAERAASGDLGEALMVQVSLWCGWGYGGLQWREEAEDQGFFLWLGCWYVDVIDRVLGSAPVRAGVIGGRAMNGDLMDYGWATLEYPGGNLGQFQMSMVAPVEQETAVRITGTEGELHADIWTGVCRWRRRGEDWREVSVPCAQPIHGFAGMRESIADFLECVRSGSRPQADLAVSRRVHRAALACMRSDETGEMAPVESV